MADRSAVLHVTLKIRPGEMGRFHAVMAEIVPALEERGWRLLGAWSSLIGPLNTVVDLWEVEDANAVGAGLTALAGHPDFGRWYETLGEVVLDENLQLMQPVPYMH